MEGSELPPSNVCPISFQAVRFLFILNLGYCGWNEISCSRGTMLTCAAASSPPWPYGSTWWVAAVQRANLIRVMSFEQHEDLILLFEEGYVWAHQNASLFSAKATNYPPSSSMISLKDSLGSAEILSRSSTFRLNESVSQNICRVHFS